MTNTPCSMIHSLWYDLSTCRIHNMTRVRVIRRIQRGCDSFPRDWTHYEPPASTWCIHMWYDAFPCDMTPSCVTLQIHVWSTSQLCSPPNNHGFLRCEMIHWHDAIDLCETWLLKSMKLNRSPSNIFTCHITESRLKNLTTVFFSKPSESTRLIHIWYASLPCEMTHWHVTWQICVRHDSFNRKK